MTVLGLSVFCDASAALVVNGKIVCAIEEERLNRDKHFEGFPWLSIDECLRIASLKVQDIDAVAVGWNPYMGWGTRISASIKDALRNPLILGSKLNRGGNYLQGIKQLFRLGGDFHKRYGIELPPIHYVPHHLAHAASCYLASDYDRAHVVIADGVGEANTYSIFSGEGDRLTRGRFVRYPHSLGHIYASVTAFLGFRPAYDEGKVMALASFGKDRYRELFDDLCKVIGDGRAIKVRNGLLDYHRARLGRFSSEWLRRTSLQPRKHGEPLESVHEDLACSLQASLERTMFTLLRNEFAGQEPRPLCAAGGLFLNSVLNGRLVREFTPELFVQPAAGDNGVSIGAGLYLASRTDPHYHRQPMRNAFLGTSYSDDELALLLEDTLQPHTRPQDTADVLADDIIAGKVVARFCGGMEFGPRALGNRSILASPTVQDMKDTLNRKVKHREPFRPFAAAILQEDISEYFVDANVSPYMLKVFYFKQEYRDMFPAICHVDGSCRIQTITKEQNPDLHALLICLKQKTGHGIALNTSLNIAGEPIVRTPEEALKLLEGTDVDVLYLGPFAIQKSQVSAALSGEI